MGDGGWEVLPTFKKDQRKVGELTIQKLENKKKLRKVKFLEFVQDTLFSYGF